MREEKYYITDNKFAINEKTNKKELKEDTVIRFNKETMKNDCKKIIKEEEETIIRYKAIFSSRNTLTIVVDKNYINENQNLIRILNKSVKNKELANKEKKLKQILISGSFILVGSLIGGKIVSKIHENQNQTVTIENPANFKDERESKEAEKLVEGREIFEQTKEQQMKQDIKDYRNLDTMPYVEKVENTQTSNTQTSNTQTSNTKDYYNPDEYEEMMNEYRNLDTMPYVEYNPITK